MVFLQCAGAGASSADHSGQTLYRSLGSRTGKVSHLWQEEEYV